MFVVVAIALEMWSEAHVTGLYSYSIIENKILKQRLESFPNNEQCLRKSVSYADSRIFLLSSYWFGARF